MCLLKHYFMVIQVFFFFFLFSFSLANHHCWVLLGGNECVRLLETALNDLLISKNFLSKAV